MYSSAGCHDRRYPSFNTMNRYLALIILFLIIFTVIAVLLMDAATVTDYNFTVQPATKTGIMRDGEEQGRYVRRGDKEVCILYQGCKLTNKISSLLPAPSVLTLLND